jgi:uncharacterized membrane protein YkvA (DUF1232 family)
MGGRWCRFAAAVSLLLVSGSLPCAGIQPRVGAVYGQLGDVADTMGPMIAAPPQSLQFERRFAVGARKFVRSLGRRLRQLGRTLLWILQRWADWTVEAVVFTFLALLAPALHQRQIRIWRMEGLGAFLVSLRLGVAVFIRLVLDRRAPLLGKCQLIFAVAYGIAPADLIPDRYLPQGLLDDVLLVAMASLCFVRLCDDKLVNEQAAIVSRRLEAAGSGRAWALMERAGRPRR